MKKFTSIACGVALSVGAVAAYAAPATLIGTSQTNLSPAFGGADLGHGDYTGSGDAILVGGVFDSANFTWSAHLTSAADATIDATTTGTFGLTAGGILTETYTSCIGSSQVCSQLTMNNPTVYDLNTIQGGHYDFSDLSALIFGFSVTAPVPGLGLPGTTVYSYEASAVPVPAAVWLFGSALLGLAGAGRQRKFA